MPLYRLRTVLCALALLSGHVSANALHTAPAVPAQVSNAAWEEDMQRFAESDARQPPPKYGIVFVGSSSIRFWETLAQDFQANRSSTAVLAARKCATARGTQTAS